MICLVPFLISLLLSLLTTTTTATAHPTVYIIRHAEKPADKNEHGLNTDGLKRAQCLREVFGAGSPYNIGYIIAPTIKWKHGNGLTDPDGDHRRPYDTVLPLAMDLGLTIDTSCKRSKPKCVKKLVKHYKGPGNILISWRHGTLRKIAVKMGDHDAPEYPKDRYDLIWTVPYPYDNVTDVTSEFCPDLDAPAVLKTQG